MPRPRTISDTSLLEAALTVMHTYGPDAMTFASVAKAAGLAPATLVQRFGSKEHLVEAALLHAWDTLDARTEAADTTTPVTVDGAISLLVGLSGHGNRDQHANGLLLLREDFRNTRLRARGLQWRNRLATILGRRLTPQVKRQAEVGRLLANQWQGAVIWWGFSRHTEIEAFIAKELYAFTRALLSKKA